MSFQPEEFLIQKCMVAAGMPSRAEVRLDLAAEVLTRFGEVRFVVQGGSMIPAIYPGDLVIVRSASIAGIRPADVVLCLHEGRFWMHRVARKWPEGKRLAFATQGDALPHEDPPVDENQLLGSVASIIRFGKSVELAQSATFWFVLLRWFVRNSTFVATSALRLHSLRTRIFRSSADAFVSAPRRSPESVG